MASVDLQKRKGAQSTKRLFRHCCADTREQDKHKNQDIQKELTAQNTVYGRAGSYAELSKAYDDRIAELDATTNKNKRKDRVTCIAINIPRPRDLSPDKVDEFYNKAYELLQKDFGEQNVLGMTVHKDEIHDYYSNGEKHTSREHGHAFVIPEKDGKLVCKQIMNKDFLKEINQQFDTMSRERFGVQYLTHDAPRKKSVEELKEQSFQELSDMVEVQTEAVARQAVQYDLVSEELERSRKMTADLTIKNKNLKQENDQLTEKNRELRTENTELRAENAELRSENKELRERLDALTMQTEQKEQRLSEVKAEIHDKITDFNEHTAPKIKEKRKELRKLTDEADALEERNKTVQQGIDNYNTKLLPAFQQKKKQYDELRQKYDELGENYREDEKVMDINAEVNKHKYMPYYNVHRAFVEGDFSRLSPQELMLANRMLLNAEKAEIKNNLKQFVKSRGVEIGKKIYQDLGGEAR